MAVELIRTQNIPDNDKKWVFLQVDSDGDTCDFIHTAPIELDGADLQAYLDARKDSYHLDILKDMYPGAVFDRDQDETELDAFKRWIAEGCVNPDSEVIEKQPWTYRHPAIWPVSGAEKESMIEDMAALIADMSYADVADMVDNLFGSLAAGQRTYLKRVGQAVIYLLRK